MNINSRFATKEEILSAPFKGIVDKLISYNHQHNLVDHKALNQERCTWIESVDNKSPALYGPRMWEYPFAITSAELERGMTCADIGCGTSPFTALLAEMTGSENVTGVDPDYLPDDLEETHSMFGVRQSFIDKIGFNFVRSSMDDINAPDESFDRVFCISVLEHISDEGIWHKGVKEMVRILKPGGRLILTVDLGINLPLTHPLEIIKVSGLHPLGGVFLDWPTQRFVNLEDEPMDVFGIVLQKTDSSIYADNLSNTEIPLYQANSNFVPPTFSNRKKQILYDLERNNILRIIAKLFLGKYN